MEWICLPFKELSPYQVYDCLRLRSEVFVVEQACIFLDADNYDQQCHHLMGYKNEMLVAYTRLVPPSVIYTQASIGRVVTSPTVRSSGIGKQLIEASIKAVYRLYNEQPIKIGAQLYLKKFYESFGFQQVSAPYLEDGIEHIYMIKD